MTPMPSVQTLLVALLVDARRDIEEMESLALVFTSMSSLKFFTQVLYNFLERHR